MITPTVPNNNDQYCTYTHCPHTAPDPQVSVEPDLYSHQQHYYVNPPHSPHTTSTLPPTNSPALSQCHYSDYSSPSTHAPHTAPAQFTSLNPSPQAGGVQLDFIPLPTMQPSAPPQPYTVPDANEGAKYEPSTSTPLTSSSYQHSAAPSPYPEHANGLYTGYENQQQQQQQQQRQQPYVLPPLTSPYPAPPSHHQVSQQPSYDNVTFVEATPIELNDGKYNMSPEAGGSTFLQNLRNPRKKTFWIFLAIVLAIIFGVLGATVWKPDNNKGTGIKIDDNQATPTTPTATGSAPSRVVPTPVGQPTPPSGVVPTPVTVAPTGPAIPPTNTDSTTRTTSTTDEPPQPPRTASPPKPTPTSSSWDDYIRCTNACTDTFDECESGCNASDSAYRSCASKCNSSDPSSEFFCVQACKDSSGCFNGCSSSRSTCTFACGTPSGPLP
ncbi:hypothetical protein BGZ52_009801 [Haplosporangium bisporale]|nr:hypothetical protein BGZ52_009801 [Haplosporangium bisporale]